MIFIDNKYTKIYFNIIKRSKTIVYTVETEKHHIIPKSLGGGDSIDNIVAVSIREHYILHKLLTKMVEGENLKKMWWALHRMSTKHLKIYNSKLYEKFRIEWALYIKENHHSKRIDGWSDIMSEAAKKSWDGDLKRKQEFSEKMKKTVYNIRNQNEELYIEEMRIRAKKGGQVSKDNNSTKIEYKGKIYYGWKDLYILEGISKSNYKKYYENGYDPSIRMGKDGAITYDDILEYACGMGMSEIDIIKDMFIKKIISQKSEKNLTIRYYKENQ